jgi:hypothetical protein
MKVPIQLFLLSCAVLTASAVVPFANTDPSTDKAAPINFNRDIKPILSEHCFKCHGPDVKVVASGLRLDSFEQATKKLGNGQAIVPGKPEASLLWQKVSNPDRDMAMPPADAGVPELTPVQKDLLKRWIESGGKYEVHWSLVPPKMPAIPKVSDPNWCKNPIDRFVLARLDQAKLKPEPEADRETLAMRASITLTGLQPRPDQVEEFVRDTKPNAYERFVDKLLASPEYGENQARYWLDAVRYGDTHGLHLDNERSVYPYRDWVVRAFNEDLPFDKFTVWQIAGDLLPKPTVDQKIATGYVRMNPTSNEGGAIEEEFLARNTFDRVDTTSTIFLGMTIGCARCHDHKYDPIKQKEYYGLFAFFNSTKDSPLDGNDLIPPPVMRAPTPEQEKSLAVMDKHLAMLKSKTSVSEALTWLNSSWRPMPTATAWQVSPPYQASTFDEAYARQEAPEKGEKVDWKPIDFMLNKERPTVIGKDNASAYVTGKLKLEQAIELPFTVSSDDAIKVWVNGKLVHENKALRGLNQSQDQAKASFNAGENTILIKVINASGPDGLFMRFGDAASERIDMAHAAWNGGKVQDRNAEELKQLFLEAGTATPTSLEFRKVKASRDAFEASLPLTLVAEELPKPRPSFVLRRGEYNLKGEPAPRVLPAALGSIPKNEPMNRLGLAKWLVSKDNPLTARVFVNRLWQQHFGTGIVKTAEDFGSQGDWPVDPQLLDYLAVMFQQDGWSIKRMNRLIVTSAAFRQRSGVDKDRLAKDPENRLISRGPRFRLDAEVIRDKALEASGLLVDREGGHGFKPYQPDGLWEQIAFAESNTSKYAKDMSEDIYRRSLYLFWKRTSPHPVMLAFDAPMRESCTVRRSRTNTPLQALVAMNEPAFVEASRVMAQRILQEEVGDKNLMDRAFLYCLGRKPSATEAKLMNGALVRYRARFAGDASDAEKMLKVGDTPRDMSLDVREHAAWMLVCSTIMNTDEFLTQH